jgi:NhaP-type Na+/H+ or K+/H+ antiporter
MNLFGQEGQEMKTFKRILIFVFIAVLLMLEANHLVAQGPFSILTGKVVGIRGKIWLDVESENDKAIVNFRIGRKTVYVPHRYPNPGERVKVEYLIQRG